MLNDVVIMGRLVRDPELRRTGNETAVTSFTVAVDRDFPNKETNERGCDFFDCVAWRNTAEFIAHNFLKGKMICVKGRLQTRSWETREGDKRKVVEIVADGAYFCGSKSETSQDGRPQPIDKGVPADFTEIDDDAELPF